MAGANRSRRHPNSKGAFMKKAQSILSGFAALALSACAFAQTTALSAKNTDSFPSAPAPQMPPSLSGTMPSLQTPSPAQPSAPQGASALTLKDAEALALKNNPQISVSRLLALASQQVVREVRSN